MLASPMLQDVQALTVPVVIAILGGIALLLALLGELEVRGQVVIPKIPRLPRIISFLVGGILIGIAIWLAVRPVDGPPPPPPLPSDTPSATNTLLATNTFIPTIIPTPSNTPTLSPTPCPAGIVCEIFPQVGDGVPFVFRYKEKVEILTDEYADECAHSGKFGLRLTYNMAVADYGGWGVHWHDTPSQSINLSEFTALVFAVKGTAGGEIFRIGLKDLSGYEVTVESKNLVRVSASEWAVVTIPLNQFAYKGKQIDTDSVENITFDFDKSHGTGSICIDDIAFAP